MSPHVDEDEQIDSRKLLIDSVESPKYELEEEPEDLDDGDIDWDNDIEDEDNDEFDEFDDFDDFEDFEFDELE